MNKEEVGTRYTEIMARKCLLTLLRSDRQALLRVMSDIKFAIYEEEAAMEVEELMRKIKR